MTNKHNLEGNEGAHSLHTPHPMSHWEWEKESLWWRKFQGQYPGRRHVSVVRRSQKEVFRERWSGVFSVEPALCWAQQESHTRKQSVLGGVGLNWREREEGRAGSQEGRRQCPRRLEVEDGLEIPDNNGRTEQVPVKLSGILICHQHQICSSSTSRSEMRADMSAASCRAASESWPGVRFLSRESSGSCPYSECFKVPYISFKTSPLLSYRNLPIANFCVEKIPLG